jgi:hypothetical protein
MKLEVAQGAGDQAVSAGSSCPYSSSARPRAEILMRLRLCCAEAVIDARLSRRARGRPHRSTRSPPAPPAACGWCASAAWVARLDRLVQPRHRADHEERAGGGAKRARLSCRLATVPQARCRGCRPAIVGSGLKCSQSPSGMVRVLVGARQLRNGMPCAVLARAAAQPGAGLLGIGHRPGGPCGHGEALPHHVRPVAWATSAVVARSSPLFPNQPKLIDSVREGNREKETDFELFSR